MARSGRPRDLSPRLLVLDSGAVIALSRGNARARAYLQRARELMVPVEVPVVVLAETLRGGRGDAAVHRVLKAVGPAPATREAHGRTAGKLLGAARSTSTIDALVVAHAIEAGGADVLTGDREDLERLAARHPGVRVLPL